MTIPISIVRHLISPEVLNTIVMRPGVRFISLLAPTQEEALDEAVEIDFKASVRADENIAKLRYALGGDVTDLRMWAEPVPDERVATAFYSSGQASVLFSGEQTAGVHELDWNGRDATADLRLLLGGVYLLKATATVDGEPKACERRIKVAAPLSWNVGMDYRHGGTHHLSDREVDAATNAQQSLSDGSAYRATGMLGTTALETMTMWQSTAVAHFGGHSSPVAVDFHEINTARATTFWAMEPAGEPDVGSDAIPDDGFRDMLLMVLCGCNSGNEVKLVQERLLQLSQKLDPQGVDGGYGPNTRTAVAHYQWCKGLRARGAPTAETLAALGEPPQPQLVGDEPDPTLLPEPIVTSIQRKLLGYSREMNPGARANGRVSGRWNDRTESAVRLFQELCNLPVTGLPDQATLDRMDLGVEERQPRNLAEYWVKHGCDVALGFTLSIAGDHASAWGQRFWRHAKEGMGVTEAAQEALKAVPRRGRAGLRYNIYAGDGVDPNLSIAPARYGRGAAATRSGGS
jgi:hypothetical protein